jgi:hypothetical protein
LAIVQVGGDDKDPMHGKDIREVILHHLSEIVYHPEDQKVIEKLPTDPLASLVTLMEKFLGTLHEPVESPATLTQSDIFITGWMHSFKEVDTSLLLKEYGLELTTRLLTLRHYSPNTEQSKQFVDLLAWLAMIAQEPLRVSLPAVSDMLAFKGRPAWTHGSWDCKLTDTSYGPPAPDPADSLAGEDDTLYRTLVCQAGNAGPDQPRYFRMPDRHPKHPRLPPPVLSGWSWPAKNDHRNFMYWWRSVLRPHCAEHLLALKETADFHSAFLLRFCYLFQLFSAQPDPRVPRYVAACIKASLLHFKYWWDEPAADDADEKVREMTFWSENHQIQFHASQFLAGQLFPHDVFPRSGKAADGTPITGSEHLKKGRERLEHWLDRRLAMGFSEWNAPGYYNEDFPSLLSLVDFSLDKTIANKAAMVTDLMVFDLARNTCRGSFGVTAGRAYFEHKAYGWEQSVGEAIEVLFGTRGDHLANEATAIAFCTSLKYQVPDALLAGSA